MTFQLHDRFAPQLESYGLTRLFQEIEMPLVEVLARMESEGISIDLEWFRSLKARFKAEREAVEREIHEIAGMEFNINSNPQLQDDVSDVIDDVVRRVVARLRHGLDACMVLAVELENDRRVRLG